MTVRTIKVDLDDWEPDDRTIDQRIDGMLSALCELDPLSNAIASIEETVNTALAPVIAPVVEMVQDTIAEMPLPGLDAIQELAQQPWMIAMQARVAVHNERRHVLQARTRHNLAELGQQLGIDDCERAFDLIEQSDHEGLRALADDLAQTYPDASDVALLRAVANSLDTPDDIKALFADELVRSADVAIPCAHRRAHKRRDVATQPVCAHAPPRTLGLQRRPLTRSTSAVFPKSPKALNHSARSFLEATAA